VTHPQHVGATEGALAARAALGDHGAFDALVARHHGAVALLARLVAPEDRRRALVVQTFDVARATLRRKLGPAETLRPFLLMTARRVNEESPRDAFGTELVVSTVPFREPAAGEMHPAVPVVFSRLPEAWQLLVWQLEVERDSVEEAAALIGVSPLVVPALLEGSRAALRRALLDRHRARTLPPACLAHTLRLGRNAGVRPPRVVLRHTAECERCAELLGDLDAVDRDLGEVLARHLLGWAAEDYLAARRTRAVTRAGAG
jgi:hypothetical protein